MVKISPSILSADFAILGAEVENIKNAGAEMAHIDVMDGMFVTNMSFAFPIIASLRKVTDMFLDVHLMIHKPERYIDRFIDSGADLITFHIEATDDVEGCIKMIKDKGKKVSLSVKPNTPIESVYPYLDDCDMILVMTVEPGYGGQSLIPFCLDKVKALRAEIEKRGLDIDIQVDGGINEATAKDAIAAGANVLVAGSAVFNCKDRKAAIDALR
ncbi:MAG: ribulose-phosphate 3-epimerase [Clostridia bacterium]|nr:ribulose-phosphate 3-epimerase [Clostridia bacterium]